MKVLLCEDVKKLGWLGDVVEVSEGYARNYLLPQGLAVVATKANEQGVLFGSVSARQIAANLREQGFEVADEVVQLPEHIKQIGTHTVTLRFADDLTATVNVVVVPEQESTPETDGT